MDRRVRPGDGAHLQRLALVLYEAGPGWSLCTIYADRPQLCRDYEAGSDPLCIEHVPAPNELKGIPICAT